MRALAIDTSSYRAEVALWESGACVARERNVDPARHAESLLGLIDGVFRSAGWQKGHLELVIPCLGPGSFTGVRVGLATAKGIALALGCPIVGVSGLEVMASAFVEHAPELARETDVIVPLLDARKGEVFWGAYGPDARALGGPGHVAAGRLVEVLAALPARRVLLGEVGETSETSAMASVHRSPETDMPDVAQLAKLGVRTLERRGPDELGALEPIYVRPPDITLPRPK